MSKKGSKTAPAPGRAASRATTPDFRAVLLGILVFASSLTTVLPAFAPTGIGRTRSVAVLAVAAGWLVAWALGAIRFRAAQLWWLAGLAALGASVVVSSLTGRFPLSQIMGGLGSGMGAVQWVALLVIAAGASCVVLDRAMRRWISSAYVWVVPVALFGIWQAVSANPVTAGLVNRDLFGLAMLLWLAPAAGLAIGSATPLRRWGWSATATAMVVAILASGGRVASIGVAFEAGLMLAIVGASLLPSGRTAARWMGATLAALAGAATLAALAVSTLGGTWGLWVAERLGPTMAARAYLYQGAMRAFAGAPVLGVGPEGYQLAAQSYVQPALMALEHGRSITDATAADPHSVVLRALVALGVVGSVALIFTLIGWAVAITYTEAPPARERALRDGLAIGAVGFALGTLMAPWPLVLGASPVLVAGLAAGGFSAEGEVLRVPRVARWVVTVALGGVFVFAAWSTTASFASFTAAVNSASAQERQSNLDAARAAAPWDETARFQALWGLGMAVEDGSGDVGAFQHAVDADPLATAYAPELAEFVRQSLLNAQLSGRTDVTWERAHLARAASLAPNVPEVAAEQLHLAVVLANADQIRAAIASGRGVAEPAEYYADYLAQADRALAK